jgi:hypothetical protein
MLQLPNALGLKQKDMLAWMGMTTLLVQVTEKIIRLAMTFVIQNATPLTLEVIQAQEQAEQKKTIGYFLTELRKRVDLDDHFDEILCEFLRMRNTFAHNLDEIPGWTLNNAEGLAVAHTFLSEFIRVINIVQSVFIGLVRAWQEQIGVEDDAVSDHPIFAKIDAIYKPLAAQIFFEKE